MQTIKEFFALLADIWCEAPFSAKIGLLSLAAIAITVLGCGIAYPELGLAILGILLSIGIVYSLFRVWDYLDDYFF